MLKITPARMFYHLPPLEGHSLLVRRMRGDTQIYWRHGIAKEKQA